MIFDPATGSWTPTGAMAQGRYYPTLTVLPNGARPGHLRLRRDRRHGLRPRAGRRQHLAATDRRSALDRQSLLSRDVRRAERQALPGRLPQGTTRYLSTAGDGQWTTVGNRVVADRRLGSAVMYAPGKILYAGGGDPPTSSAEVIDLNQASPAWRSVPGMQFARRQMNATILADGQVLVTNGTSGPGFNDVGSRRARGRAVEPGHRVVDHDGAGEWWGRTYHSAVAAAPGRTGAVHRQRRGRRGVVREQPVQRAGIQPALPLQRRTARRPRGRVISSAPARITYGGSFTVETPGRGIDHPGEPRSGSRRSPTRSTRARSSIR